MAANTITQLAGNSSSSSGGASGSVTEVGSLIGANFNVTTDQPIALTAPAGATKWVIDSILITNPSTSLTTAKGAFYGSASKTNAIFGITTTAYTGLVNPTDWGTAIILGFQGNTAFATGSTNGSKGAGNGAQTFTGNTTIYLSLTTPQGGAATADIYIFGRALV